MTIPKHEFERWEDETRERRDPPVLDFKFTPPRRPRSRWRRMIAWLWRLFLD